VIVCARAGCEQKFDRSAHNQKYCSSECLRDATNQRFREKYHENKANANRGPRFCDCGSRLSKYNSGDQCAKCEASTRSRRTKELRDFIRGLTD
jgi:hypothetical protein